MKSYRETGMRALSRSRMRSFVRAIAGPIAGAVVGMWLFASCGAGAPQGDDGVLRVVTTFSLLGDVAQAIGGEHVQVHNLVPIGTDPHTYTPLPEDLKAATDADVLMYNGLNLEGGEHGWFFRMLETVEQDPARTVEAFAGLAPRYISDSAGETKINPHAFISPRAGRLLVENMRDGLIQHDPGDATVYEENARAYLAQIDRLEQQYAEFFAQVPQAQRILVTSERAFQYLAADYDLQEGYLWAIDTDENGSPEQLTSLVDFIRNHDVPVLFVESNVDPRPMQAVAAETGVPLGGILFSDEIGEPGDPADTYLKYLQANLDVFQSAFPTRSSG